MPGSEDDDPSRTATSSATTEILEPIAKVLTELVHSVANIQAYLTARDDKFSFGHAGTSSAVQGSSLPPSITSMPPPMSILPDQIRVDVELRQHDLQMAMHWVRAYERRAEATAAASGQRNTRPPAANADTTQADNYPPADAKSSSTSSSGLGCPGILKLLQVATSDHPTMRMAMANGNRVPCKGVTHGINICIHDEDFVISCLSIDLGGFDVVLGVKFLRTLGPIL
ncbi:hypothetical protein GUJ93_ZPchr0010g7214 [Zizania palustris]|uniref:Uncharacterized protein n=1 Tax=Zizania palustris TaxID=103762 RepID=A0A8J5WFH7_ZIZPA|nr:hypothetical protein GUJ93_ZPchr0010g7214 [Zizania palustris]